MGDGCNGLWMVSIGLCDVVVDIGDCVVGDGYG